MVKSRKVGDSSLPKLSDELGPSNEQGNSGSASSQISQQSSASSLAEIASSSAVSKIFTALGSTSKLHLVGGTVRDCIAGSLDHTDLDLATVLQPQDCLRLLEAAGLRVIPTGLQHGTVTVVVDSHSIEITTFRKPGPHFVTGYSDSIEEDLAGRDFTANAIAYDISAKSLVDPYHGVQDTHSKMLRAVGSPKARFEEDPLRILRLVRLGYARGWRVDQVSAQTAKELGSLLTKVSIERIRTELEKIVLSEFAGAGLRALRDLGLLPYTVPELEQGVGFEQNEFHIHDVFEHIVWVVERVPRQNRLVRLAALFHDIGKPATLSFGENGRRHFFKHEHLGAEITKERMEQLKFSNDDIKNVSALVRYHMRPLDCGVTAVRRLMRDLGELFEPWKALKRADATPTIPQEEFEAQLSKFEELVRFEENRVQGSIRSPLAIDGNDLIQLGLVPGPALGALLKSLEELIIEAPESNEREYLLGVARSEISKLAGQKT